jgi:sugar lactone lactonase YvrE
VISAAKRARVRVALRAGDQLGEGPVWDDRTRELLRVDITAGLAHAWDPASHRVRTHAFDGDVSAVVPRADAPGWIVAVGRRLLLCEESPDTARPLATVEPDRPGNRFNDCRCDPQGRLWAGTMSKTREPGVAALYRLSPGGEPERVIAGTTISNGLGWSPAGDRMYFVDSTTQRVDVLDFDAATGAVSGRRALVEIDPRDGLPDGMAIDAEGGIWVCLFGGAAVRRYSPEGVLDAAIALPTTNPTCPAFGGADLRTLYVTTARHRLSPEQLADEPNAGDVLALDPGVRGMPAYRFGG